MAPEKWDFKAVHSPDFTHAILYRPKKVDAWGGVMKLAEVIRTWLKKLKIRLC